MQFGYAFDDIGNRTTATTNGREADYTANALNQYSEVTVPGAIDVLGTANSAATVTVNRQAVTRAGAYYSKTLTVDNSAGPVWQEVKVVGVRKNAGPDAKDVVTESTGHEFVPQTPEAFTYDDDGNMTADGRWAYTWDGENRLVKIEAASGLPAGARKKIEFAYDGQSRRVEKKSYGWSGTAWVLASDLVFLYDGWNLIAELNAGDLSLVRKYCWGLDLSGALQGAGGVAGLLAVTSTTATQFAAYDGNGNVVALIDAATGAEAARYEYDPFGNTLVQTGAAAAGNPFRFSTKYTDAETGLLYYGLRYYNPAQGRWINKDPIEEEGGANLYGFATNESISNVDYLGQKHIPGPFIRELTAAERKDLDKAVSEIVVTSSKYDLDIALFRHKFPNLDSVTSAQLKTLPRDLTSNFMLEEWRKACQLKKALDRVQGVMRQLSIALPYASFWAATDFHPVFKVWPYKDADALTNRLDGYILLAPRTLANRTANWKSFRQVVAHEGTHSTASPRTKDHKGIEDKDKRIDDAYAYELCF